MKTRTLFTSALLLVTGGAAIAQSPASPKPTKADVVKADLFIAITKQRPGDVKAALARGADPNRRNWLTLTPVMWASMRGNSQIVELLLQKGANINDSAIIGSALTMAEIGRNEKMALSLLDKGVNPNITTRLDKATPLMLAAANGHTQVIARLLQKKCDPNFRDTDGATALIWATRAGQIKAVAQLLQAKANANQADSHGCTPLMYAAMNGHADIVDTLLKNGAEVQTKDGKGATALLLAARYSGNPAIVRSLVQKNADLTAKDANGQTALSLTRDRSFAEAESFIREGMPTSAETPAPRQTSVRYAAEKSLAALQSGMQTFTKAAACISCHHQGLGLMAVGRAAQKGLPIDQKLVGSYFELMAKEGKGSAPLIHEALQNKDAAKLVIPMDIGDFPITFGYVMSAMAAHGVPQNPGLGEVAQLLAQQQEADGRWQYAFHREPMQSSHFTTTALALNALHSFAPKEKQTELDSRYAQAKQWLLTTSAPNTEDKASRLIGLKTVGANGEERAKAIQELLAAQRPDGGWAQLPTLASDAYATGMAVYALRVAGDVASTDPAIQRGIQYLLRMQDEDGTWFVNKRTMPANTYFDAGFPHGQSQFTSFAGSSWALMALLEVIEPKQVAQN